jgi:TorA maturation chaperone TorD
MLEETTSKSEELSELVEFRSKIYGFLSSVYIQSPSHNFVEKLLGEEVSSFLSTLLLGIGLPQAMEEGLEDIRRFIKISNAQAVEDVHQSLCVEHTRLFRGVMPGYGPPPPYESVYREEGVLMGKSTVEVQRKYGEACVCMPAEYNEPPDYIGLELDFMRFLTEGETESWRNGARDNALAYLNTERDFLSEHIMKWIPGFCDKVVEIAELDFYRGIARMTKGFISDDCGKVEGLTDIEGQS